LKSNEKFYIGGGLSAEVLIPETPGLKLLDLGCGSGSLARRLKQRQSIDVYGVTASESEQRTASEVMECKLHDLEKGLPKFSVDKFDVVVMSHFLEHIAFPERLLKDIKDALTSQGVLIVVLPNCAHYNGRFRLLRGIFEYEEAGLYDYTHLRWFTFTSAERLFLQHGFHTEFKDVHVCLPFGRLTNRIPSKRLKKWLTNMLKRISPGLFGAELQYVFKLAETSQPK
jgi:methionine biosynthesis protein MetW